MAMFRMNAEDVHKRATSLYKTKPDRPWSVIQKDKIDQLVNLIHMSNAADQYGVQENFFGSLSIMWIDIEEAKVLGLI